ncbi:hypothetical protein [Limnohabitans sp. Bal53]|nr:hypothetical protein [Limnohabitans sp. Bal53]
MKHLGTASHRPAAQDVCMAQIGTEGPTGCQVRDEAHRLAGV